MKRLASLTCLLVITACSRARGPSAPPAAHAQPAVTAQSESPRASTALAALPSVEENEAEEQRELMRAAQGVSAFAPTEDGLRGFVTAFAHEVSRHDREGVERFEHELVPDNSRFALALDFEGSRHLRDRVVPTIEASARSLETRLAALRAPLNITVTSALGSELAAGASHGFGLAVTSQRAHLRTAVRFHRVEVAGADGGRVVIEPMAFLAGRWTWLGDTWPTPAPVVPTGATGPTAAR